MTRETKIGLLVGLAFIIIVGILLSEPLNHSGDAQPAPLPYAGQNVRTAVASPGTGSSQQPPISLQPNPTPAQPTQQVLTQQEVNKPQGGIQIVVGTGETATNNAQPQHRTTTQLANNTPAEPPAARTEIATNDNKAASNHSTVDAILQDEAAKNGEALVPAGTKPDAPANAGGVKGSTKAGREYEVAPGDSLSKIAQKFYGSSSKQYRDAIVAANPSLKADPNRLIAGVKYVIPAVEKAGTTTAQNNPTPVVPKVAPKPAESSEHFYTVKAGDNLWAIARDQCGDTAALAALKELNKGTLKGGEGIQVGMKLRLPTKPVASIN